MHTSLLLQLQLQLEEWRFSIFKLKQQTFRIRSATNLNLNLKCPLSLFINEACVVVHSRDTIIKLNSLYISLHQTADLPTK
jgi:hypothetical protein